jgi:DNA-binding IclR family transcriptional regulator
LRRLAQPHLEELVARCNETANLQVLVGDHVRFVASVESEHVLRVGNRAGRMLPAHLASGGLALLACLREAEIDDLYAAPDASPVDLPRLHNALRQTRKRGYALNNQNTEPGVTAIGRPVRGPDGTPLAAVCIAVPSIRFSRDRLTEWSIPHTDAVTALERELRGVPH